MTAWKLALVQCDCAHGQPAANRAALAEKLNEAADHGAKLIAFPECVIAGYGFASRAEAINSAEPIPGPSTEFVVELCAARNVWCVFGLLEKAADKLFNTAAVIGPKGLIGTYRKTHLPCVGADRFTYPGQGPLELFDLDGLKLGIGICFDGGFPEFPRALALLGADLILLPTNWAEKAATTAKLIPPVRAFENGVFFGAINRIGVESGYRYIGRSSLYDPAGQPLAAAEHDGEEILYGEIDPVRSRTKRVVYDPGVYEIDRVNWRRPELYSALTAPLPKPFPGHCERVGG